MIPLLDTTRDIPARRRRGGSGTSTDRTGNAARGKAECAVTSNVSVHFPLDGVAVATMNRPDRLNAMNVALISDLSDALQELAANNSCRVVILTGAQRAFSSGLDLKDAGLVPNVDGLSVGRIALRSMRHYSRVVTMIRDMPQVVIAAVNGVAFGGGMCLAMACDLRFGSQSASFNATGIVNGLTAAEMGVSWLLPRQVGAAVSNDLLLTGRVVEAAEAYRLGLISRLVADDELLPSTLETAARMARFSPYGLTMTKTATWASLEISSLAAAIEFEDRNQLMLGFTDNLPEAISAFAAKRDPNYRDDPRRDIWPEPV